MLTVGLHAHTKIRICLAKMWCAQNDIMMIVGCGRRHIFHIRRFKYVYSNKIRVGRANFT